MGINYFHRKTIRYF